MSPLSALGFGAFLLSSLVVGLRLLLLWRRTRRFPELMIGMAILGYGPLGYGVVQLARRLPPDAVIATQLLTLAGLLSLSAAAGALFYFTWRVYHPSEPWARIGCFLCLVLLALGTAGDLVARVLGDLSGVGPGFWLAYSLRSLALAWSAFEALRYFGLMRKRLALGLADPVVKGGFLLWGIGATCAGLGFVASLVVRAATGLSVTQRPELVLPFSLLALVAAVSIWLAFFPPASYLRVVRRAYADPA